MQINFFSAFMVMAIRMWPHNVRGAVMLEVRLKAELNFFLSRIVRLRTDGSIYNNTLGVM